MDNKELHLIDRMLTSDDKEIQDAFEALKIMVALKGVTSGRPGPLMGLYLRVESLEMALHVIRADFDHMRIRPSKIYSDPYDQPFPIKNVIKSGPVSKSDI